MGWETTPTGGSDRWETLAAFSVLIGLLSSALGGYRYGKQDQTVHLPEIFRAVHSSYLANDFWLNSASQFGPRFYYTEGVAFAANFIPIPAIIFFLFVCTSCVTSVVVAFAARDLSGSTVAALVMTSLSVSISPFWFGHFAGLSNATGGFVPSTLAEPFLVFAVWRGIRGEPVYAASACVPAILVHPALGVNAAGIALTAALSRCLWSAWPHCPRIRECGRFALGFLIVGFVTGLFWIVPAIASGAIFSPSMESDEFVHILAYVRHPHHLVPSTWPLGAFRETAAFAAAVLVALAAFWRSGSETDQREHLAKAVAITAVLVAIMSCFFLGWFFVEVVPTKWAAAMYFYRLVIVFAWLGWVLVGASIAKQFALKNLRWAVLGMVSVFSAPALLLYQAALFASVNETARRSTLFFVAVTVLVVVTGFVFPGGGGSRTSLLFVAVGGLVGAAAIAIFPRLAPACLAVMVAVLILIASVLALHRSGLLPERCGIPSFVTSLQPVLDLDDLRKRLKGRPQADLASAARSRTEPDALFLVPWLWLEWRILAQRAVVVDRKAYPFREEGMREWHRRYLAIYDHEHGAGYPNDCTEGTLRELQEMWGFPYAVVPSECDLPFPVIAISGKWKLVQATDIHLHDPWRTKTERVQDDADPW